MSYHPTPIDTSHVQLGPDILALSERLAEHAHDVWARQRLAEGWTHGRERNDQKRTHPCLVPYRDLPESEKVFDRNAALETLKAMIALGYEVRQPADHRA